ncbi:ABC transporter ATP-binding protein, partial [Operophtera brumata]
QLEIPAFQKVNKPLQDEIPRWSIRRSVCPVCSQKWKDRSTISNIKYSGLKRNSASELPSVIAPARLRVSIAMSYAPRPTLAVVDETVAGISIVRNQSSTWQLTRARRFRAPKPQQPSPEATAPPSAAASMARKDLDIRVN